MKVLSLMEERERAEAGGVKPTIKAIKTSGIDGARLMLTTPPASSCTALPTPFRPEPHGRFSVTHGVS